jgi:hypothetical protein
MNPELPKHETHKRIRSGKVKHVESMVGDTRTSAGIMGLIGGIIVKKECGSRCDDDRRGCDHPVSF